MFTFGRAVARIVVAGSVMLGGIAAAIAAGALAVGSCGAYGYAFDYARVDAAEREAMRQCTAQGCRVVTAMKKNCAAFAVDLRNVCGAYGFASAARLGLAQNTALRQCYGNGGAECVIRAFACDGKG
jgi:Domain of unknown function (DUF4189)